MASHQVLMSLNFFHQEHTRVEHFSGAGHADVRVTRSKCSSLFAGNASDEEKMCIKLAMGANAIKSFFFLTVSVSK